MLKFVIAELYMLCITYRNEWCIDTTFLFVRKMNITINKIVIYKNDESLDYYRDQFTNIKQDEIICISMNIRGLRVEA